MEQKLCFFDIDGTLVAPFRKPTEAVREAIRKARENGHLMFLCTGRNLPLIQPEVLEIGFDGIVASAGACVEMGGKLIVDEPMSKGLLDETVDILRHNGFVLSLECKENTYGDSNLDEALSHAPENGNSELMRMRVMQRNKNLPLRDIAEYHGEPVYKISFICAERSQLEEPMRVLGDRMNFVIHDMFGGEGVINGEVSPISVDKGTGIRAVCDYLDLPLSATIGFGDSMNDLAMIQTVAESYCMENGSEELKKQAKHLCPSVEQDGVAKALDELGLTGEPAGIPAD